MKATTKKIVYLALFTAIALVLNLIESMFPPLFAFAPGTKVGLSNVVALIAVFLLGVPSAFAVQILRCVLGAIFGGNLWGLVYSLPSAMISLTVEVVLIKLTMPKLSLTTISFVGALLHNATQLAIASLQVGVNLIVALPTMILASILAGIAVGLVAYYAIKAFPKTLYVIEKTAQNKINQ